MVVASETFKNELSGYNKQLSQPYLTDKDVSENLIQEAYERLGKDVKATHILLKLKISHTTLWNRTF